ncbi:unnamed protein product [Microthlaspi erraticum]|uniref:non-specific serine/threonine protein kinase n=1 Tax=Microthlaspi erraticum TaxID=1685480 RepID=A0A6D2KDY4_9BRAS|nr:unnamed protein product [Microthlaspi erraticum]
MRSFHAFLLLLITSYGVFESVPAQDQSEFISLACGLVPTNETFTERTTNITYKSDASYIDNGFVGSINDVYKSTLQQQAWNLRSFPEGERNCYNFNLTADRKYLIRGTFLYGNYDGRSQLPSFDLHIGPNKWTPVKLGGVATLSFHEMIHVLTQDRLQVCLVKTGETTPFISSLELRRLPRGMYPQSGRSLILFGRIYYPPTLLAVRYDEDIHDRVWVPDFNSTDQRRSISTDLFVNTSTYSYDVPQVVAKSACVPANDSQPLTFYLKFNDTNALLYVYMHFAEIQNLEADEIREFNISYNGGQRFMSNFRPPKFSIKTLSNPQLVSSLDGNFNLTFKRTRNSTRPPLINAFEVYQVLKLPLLDTDQDEASAMVNIKTSYELNKKISWQGDPCAPELYRWEGLNCSYIDSESPRILTLNLTENQLTGTITPEISKLTQLIELDLSNNDLSGDIPDFLADMKSLKLIKLNGNPNLNTIIPESLQRRLKRNSLTLILRETPRKENEKVPVVAIAVSVAVVLTLTLIVIFFVVRRKKRKIKNGTRSSNQTIITKDLRITTAVKMLSRSSAQGYKEFKAEVELLSRVHHRHLVGLVGYCNDGENLALIYEYMANGDLKENMSGKCGGNILSWESRMQVAVEAAQGLEYLHNGCEPPMVHRDVKTSNILLNERSQAKLADFGLSRSFAIDGQGHVSTAVAGTPGYLDPEYYRTNWLSETSDVYSFGVVLLEIITNQPVIDKNREEPHITEWVGFKLTNGDIRSIVDPELKDDYDTNGAWKVVELALACVNPSSNRRPTMAHVVTELNECVALEVARRQGSEKMNSLGSFKISLSSASDFAPGAR